MEAKDIAIVLAALVTLGTTLAAYITYRRKRLFFPRKQITHQLITRPLSDDKKFIRVTSCVSNVGEVPILLSMAKISLRRVLPCPQDFYDSLINGDSSPTEDRPEIPWPLIGTRFWDWGKGELELEPGETKTFAGDFVVDNEILVVESYSFVVDSHGDDRDPPIGWRTSEIHDLATIADGVMT